VGISDPNGEGTQTMKEIRKDTYIMGGENRTQINIIHQRNMKMGEDLRKELLEMIGKKPEKTPVQAADIEEIGEIEDGFVVNSMEDAIKFFVGTINSAFGNADYTANEVTDFLLTTEDSVSAYESIEGGMFLFKYEPTTATKLKYYDRLPLVINLGSSGSGLTGLNLHYLPPRYRVAFMKALFGDQDLDTLDEDDMQSRLGKISSYKFVRPTYKQYKYEGIASRLIRIPIQNWTLASLLPISSFQKQSKKDVWDDSIRMINDEERRI